MIIKYLYLMLATFLLPCLVYSAPTTFGRFTIDSQLGQKEVYLLGDTHLRDAPAETDFAAGILGLMKSKSLSGKGCVLLNEIRPAELESAPAMAHSFLVLLHHELSGSSTGHGSELDGDLGYLTADPRPNGATSLSVILNQLLQGRIVDALGGSRKAKLELRRYLSEQLVHFEQADANYAGGLHRTFDSFNEFMGRVESVHERGKNIQSLYQGNGSIDRLLKYSLNGLERKLRALEKLGDTIFDEAHKSKPMIFSTHQELLRAVNSSVQGRFQEVSLALLDLVTDLSMYYSNDFVNIAFFISIVEAFENYDCIILTGGNSHTDAAGQYLAQAFGTGSLIQFVYAGNSERGLMKGGAMGLPNLKDSIRASDFKILLSGGALNLGGRLNGQAMSTSGRASGVCIGCCSGFPKLLSCSRCRVAKYCSKECQKGDWNRHKQDCRTAPLKTGMEMDAKVGTSL